MPSRRFDGRRLREVRRAADMHQRVLAQGLGLGSHAPVATWEGGRAFPPAEKLPKIAQLLGQDLDVLFPRDGDPDLVDLRCDAGYSQGAAADAARVLSRFLLGSAERGVRRLDAGAVAMLAELYGVTSEELRAAEARSFGESVPSHRSAPGKTPTEGFEALLQAAFPGADVSDSDVASAVNAKLGSALVQPAQIAALRAGTAATDVFSGLARRIAFEGLGAVLGVSPIVFEDGASVERRVLEDIRYLAEQRDIALAARGGEGGVSPAMLSVLNELLAAENAHEQDGGSR
ncbi:MULTISPECIES: helix-turn-helix domain-containing protein [unclassified Streptomyces]|uniref:helix-turn-helix domain-containing protein n=1 Tax=Streptomyces sp. NPDC127532 TaxID=3345399 RepID=UPI0036358B14